MTYPRLLMRASALALAVPGLLALFAPDNALVWMDAPPSPPLMLIVQVLGALYLGFAGLNWMARDNLIGGMYGRPVVIGNLLHFVTAGLALLRLLARSPDAAVLWPVTAAYAAFAIGFGWVLFRHPIRSSG